MDDLMVVLLFFVFFVLPILEKIFKGRQKGPPPGQQPGQPPGERPRQRAPLPPAKRPPATPQPAPYDRAKPAPYGGRQQSSPPPREQPVGRAEAEESAAGMLPDDLWEILTGEKRQPVPPPQRPQPMPEPSGWQLPETVVWEPEAEAEEEETAAVVLPDEERATVERTSEAWRYERKIPVRAAPRIVSLETPLPPPAARHTAFHARLDQSAGRSRPQHRRSHSVRIRFQDRSELRRAVVMAEILAPPRGLHVPVQPKR